MAAPGPAARLPASSGRLGPAMGAKRPLVAAHAAVLSCCPSMPSTAPRRAPAPRVIQPSAEGVDSGAMATVKLHRCPFTFLHTALDSCWKVQKALDEQGIEYEVVKEPVFPRGRRKEVERLTGQVMLPVVEFEDGSAYRAESDDMAARIRDGRLFEEKSPTI